MRAAAASAALALVCAYPAAAQSVVVDTAAIPDVARVRARLHQLRGGRVVQPIVIVVSPRTPATTGRDGVDGIDGLGGLPGAASGRPVIVPGTGRPAQTAPPAGTPLPVLPAPGGPAALDSAQQARLALTPVEVLREVERQIVEVGLFRTSNVPFEFDRARLMPFAEQTLNVVGDVLRRYPALRVEVGGHTDAVGSDAYNLRLSERRAAEVRRYLVERWGIAPERLTAVGYGEARPVATNAHDTGRALNRRVEFAVQER